MNSFNFCIAGKVFFSPSFLKWMFSRYWILGNIFSFSTPKMLGHSRRFALFPMRNYGNWSHLYLYSSCHFLDSLFITILNNFMIMCLVTFFILLVFMVAELLRYTSLWFSSNLESFHPLFLLLISDIVDLISGSTIWSWYIFQPYS